jgi:hypothetical protein
MLSYIEYLIHLFGPLGFVLISIVLAILLGGLVGIVSYTEENEE